MSTTICLNMIVRNESRIIRRCLGALRPFIDTWVIVDTGSVDGTPDLVKETLKDLPGTLYRHEWQDFAHNRTRTIRLAEGTADLILLCDADHLPVVRDPHWKEGLTAEAYQVWQGSVAGTGYRNLRVVSGRLAPGRHWRYWGATHEYLGLEDPHQVVEERMLDGIAFLDVGDGGSKATKLIRDEALLRAELARLEAPGGSAGEPPGLLARTVYYLAQTFRDQGRMAESLALYQRRAGMGFWEEEAWHAQYQAALVGELLGWDRPTVIEALLQVHQRRPQRNEPLLHLARFCRQRGDHALAHLFARRALAIPPPPDLLFLEMDGYHWRARDEFGLAASAIGDQPAAIQAFKELLAGSVVPADQRPRIAENLAGAIRLQAVSAPR